MIKLNQSHLGIIDFEVKPIDDSSKLPLYLIQVRWVFCQNQALKVAQLKNVKQKIDSGQQTTDLAWSHHIYSCKWWSVHMVYCIFSLQSKKAVCAFQITKKLLSFTLEDSQKKLADDQWSSVHNYREYLLYQTYLYDIQCMYIKPFSMEVDWPEIGRLMKIC